MRNVIQALGVLIVLLALAPLMAQVPPTPRGETAAPAKAPSATSRATFLDLVKAGGPIGHTIIVLSVIAVALVIDYARSLRSAVFMPPGLADRVRELLQAGQGGAAVQECQSRPSVLSNVIKAGLLELDGGWSAAEKAMEETLADHSAQNVRKVEYLSVIGNIAPMLGLLGTVTGMITAFKTVAETQGVARAADLATGIYEALVTTVEGLLVAIPALAVFALFRSRVDQLISEVAGAAQHAFAPLRRARVAAATRTGAKPPPLEGSGS
ncbi:MAG: MotA/TolQ/ExbB proton channel family protein [Planctomycetaceae bacterium]|nr:MotA/TolQ/ExbB proton channel family protein [Planctomycetaceae bacterium]